MKVTPRGEPGFSVSTCGAAGAVCDQSGRARDRTFSSDRTSAVRLSDFKSSRREEGKKEYLGVVACWTASFDSYILCRVRLQVEVRGSRSDCRGKNRLAGDRMENFVATLKKIAASCVLRLCLAVASLLCAACAQTPSLELSRPVRSWEFLPVVGMNAGLFGNESGQMEAWVYPLKIFRNFHLTFHVDGRALPAESLARTLIVRPESATLVYAGDNYSVRETFFVPVHEPGAVILLDVETEQPLEIEASFTADFQLEWPAAVGGTFHFWDDTQHAFVFGEEQKKFSAIVGSPSASSPEVSYQTNYSSSDENSMR